MSGSGIRLGEGGRLEVVRSAPPEEPHRLRDAVERLRAAAGAGAVEVLAVHERDDGLEVVLAHAGRALSAPAGAEVLARVATSLAGHLADLHLRGLAHGAIEPAHVLVDAQGGVRLCGFRGGTAAEDVRAVGALLRTLLDPDDRSDAAAALRGIADRCDGGGEATVPTMAAIAASLAGVARPRPLAATSTARPRRRVPVASAAVVLALAGVLVVAVWARRPPSRPAPRLEATPTSTTTAAARSWPATGPRVLRHDGVTWTFGEDDDVVLTGDWDCDGVRTPALVRRSGAVWVVDAWPSTGEVEARYLTTVRDAVDVAVTRDATCDVLTVTTRDGTVLTPARRA